jgi:hypothetical protein
MNFNMENDQEGSGTDIVTYEFDLNNASTPLTIKAELLYQSSSPRFLNDLFGDDTPAVSRFREMYFQADNRPILIDSTKYTLSD